MADKLKKKPPKNPAQTFGDSDYSYILSKIGAAPTDVNLAVMRHWHNHELNNRTHNPFSTSQPFKGSDSRRIKNYDTRQHGLDATVDTLMNVNKGRTYRNVVNSFRTSGAQEIIKAITESPWEYKHYDSNGNWRKGKLWSSYKGPMYPSCKAIGAQFTRRGTP
jgi:hypothetical protein